MNRFYESHRDWRWSIDSERRLEMLEMIREAEKDVEREIVERRRKLEFECEWQVDRRNQRESNFK